MTCRSADDDVGAVAGRLLNKTTGLEGFATGGANGDAEVEPSSQLARLSGVVPASSSPLMPMPPP